MKRRLIFAVFFAVLSTLGIQAQENNKSTIVDDFSKNRFQWEDFTDKAYEGYIDVAEGGYVLKNKNKVSVAKSVTNLPLNIRENFKIKMKLLVPQVNNKYWFGIVFNYKDADGTMVESRGKVTAETTCQYNTFLVTEGKFKVCQASETLLYVGRSASRFTVLNPVMAQGTIVLKKGKDKEVELEIEKKGEQLIFSIDNMEATKIKEEVTSRFFGFAVGGKNTIRVKEVSVFQVKDED